MNEKILKFLLRLIRSQSLVLGMPIITGLGYLFTQAPTAFSAQSASTLSSNQSDNSESNSTKSKLTHSPGGSVDGLETGGEPEDMNTDTLENTVYDELLLFEDMPVVISAARQAQPISLSSIPVSIITAEDIHYSGLTTIPEILQFTPGMDVVLLSRTRFAVGVRGLHDFISDRTLTLINGRIADSPHFGGSEFHRIPILLEDIERIEVVRGPGGAAWGANAFTGIINIITKKPKDVEGWYATSTFSEHGDSYSHLRWGAKLGKWSWRSSVGYMDKESSEDAGAGRFSSNNPPLNPLIGFSNFSARDFNRNIKFDGEAIYAYSDETNISFGLGYSHDEMGDFEFGGVLRPANVWYETARPFTKIERQFEEGSSGYLQWFAKFENARIPSLVKWRTNENELEGQLNFNIDEYHKLSLGGNVRIIRIDTEAVTPEDLMYDGEPYDEQLAGIFLFDRWQLSDNLALEGQIRGDWYSETQTDWSARTTAHYALDKQQDHMLRLSWAKAFRAPLAALRKTETSRFSLAPLGLPGFYGFHVLQADDLKNEETWAIEGGYDGKIIDGLQFRADGYYQRFSKLIGFRRLSDPMAPTLNRAFYQPDNIDGADSFGCEFEIELKGKPGALSAWYAYNEFQEDQSHQNVRAYGPSKHKVGLTGRIFLGKGWTFNTNYRYTNVTPAFADTLRNIEISHRLDLSIAKTFADGVGEIMVGVSDVLNDTIGPHYGMGQITTHEIPGRTFFARMQVNF